KELNRLTRLRWLDGGTTVGENWNAFLAPTGCPLPVLIRDRHRLAWPETRPLLEDLAGEVAAACEDGTLPATLTLDQVWVRPNGHLQLVDTGWLQTETAPAARTDAGRAFGLLRDLAVVALEGKARPPNEPRETIRAPIPNHARDLLDRLLGVNGSYRELADLRADLAATRESPTEVTRHRRAVHLATEGAFLAIGLLWMFIITYIITAGINFWIGVQAESAEETLTTLKLGSLRDFAAQLSNPEPWMRYAAAAKLVEDRRLADGLQQRRQVLHQEEKVRFDAAERVTRRVGA